MEFLVEFETHVPDGTPESEVMHRRNEEAVASAQLGQQGHLVRLWRPNAVSGKAIGLYRADSEPQLDGLLSALPMHDWMRVGVTRLEPHPNDPGLPH
jgi:muconolactone delta-isomerase